MIFKSLKEKCEYYRSLTDYRLTPNSYILIMIDGKNFSSLIKNNFEKPFDDWFIETMNKTAEHLCKNIQNCVGAYVQSDEISLLIKDDNMTCMPFDGRLCKLQSVIPSIATSFFTKQIIQYFIKKTYNEDETIKSFITYEEITDLFLGMKDYVFDCKAWAVPNENDAIAWFLYRQNDCIRNSKQQFCQTYIPHKMLVGLDTDKQVKLCKEQTGNNWNEITDDKKYGRFLSKHLKSFKNEKGEDYCRRIWLIESFQLTETDMRDYLKYKWLRNNGNDAD